MIKGNFLLIYVFYCVRITSMEVKTKMGFLEKLNYLMKQNNLNKNTLSKSCGIPYTTIDGWYKKGYEGLKLTTLRKLADFFGTSLDFWANDSQEKTLSKVQQEAIAKLENMNDEQVRAILNLIDSFTESKKCETVKSPSNSVEKTESSESLTEAEIDELVEDFRHQLEVEKKQKEKLLVLQDESLKEDKKINDL